MDVDHANPAHEVDLTGVVSHNGSVIDWPPVLMLKGTANAWWNIATIPLPPAPPGAAVRVHVLIATEGAPVLISLADESGNEVVSAEVEIEPGQPRTAELIAEGEQAGSLLIRTAEGATEPPFVTIHSARVEAHRDRRTPVRVRDIRDAGSPIPMHPGFRRAPAVDRLLALTHTSRPWHQPSCTREYLARRYAGTKRFAAVPAFHELGSGSTSAYTGGLSVIRLRADGDVASLELLGHVESDDKIQAANCVGDELVICTERYLLALPWSEVSNRRDADAVRRALTSRGRRIADPWFAGLHTIFPVDDTTALVSASGPDAALWVDIPSGKVIRRWRLPPAQYGLNYELGPDDSVHDHYIPNDLQLGHLNSAYPLGPSGALITTLAQGDVGLVAEDSSFTRLHHGSIGCHGVRVGARGDIYFSDSCSGQLRQLSPQLPGEEWAWAESLWCSTSRWLHDAVEVSPGTFLLAHGDENAVSLVNTAGGYEIARWFFADLGANVQFLTDLDEGHAGTNGPDPISAIRAAPGL